MPNIFLPPTQFIPNTLTITAINNANPCLITVTETSTYFPGMLVRMIVPPQYGMFQMNGKIGQIQNIDTTGLIFTVNINTIQYDVFSVPSGALQTANLSPAGSQNLQYSNFTNQIAFQPLNGEGN